MLNSGHVSQKRAPTLRALALSTALAGSMAVWTPAALAQNLPTGSNVQAGSATFGGSSTNLDVGIGAQNTIIEWNSFNIAAGHSVSFDTSLTGQVGVLNRVTGPGSSTIRGQLTSDPNINIFLVNRNGILIGSGGSVSTGSFVASALDISDSDFLAGDYHFDVPFLDSRSRRVTVSGGSIETSGTGLGLILLGRQVQVNGTLDAGTQNAALVAADDVTLSFSPGSPLGIQIDEGTPIADATRVVGGTIEGRNVYFAMATRGLLTDSLLQIDGNISAVAGEKGIVIVGGRSTIDPDVAIAGPGTGNPVAVTVNGSLTYSGAATGGIAVGGTDAVTIRGNVTSSGGFNVSGRQVTLGAAGTRMQQAAGGVTITSTNGGIVGNGDLTLRANSDAVGSEALVVTANGNGNITFGANTSLEGGPSLNSAVLIFSDSRNDDVRLGDVRAASLDGGLSGGAAEGGLVRTGDISAGSLILGSGATIEADALSLGSVQAAGPVSLTADAALRVDSVTTTAGTATLVADSLAGLAPDTGAAVSASGAVDITVSGDAALGLVESTGANVAIEAASIDAADVRAATGAVLGSTVRGIRLGALRVASGTGSLDAATDVRVSGPVAIGGDYNVIGGNVRLSGTQAAAGAVTITARTGGSISNPASLTLTANSDGVGTEALTLRGRVALGSNSSLLGGSARQSSVVVDTAVANDIGLGDVSAASLIIAGGATSNGTIVLGDVTTTSDLAIRSTRSINAGDLSAIAGSVSLQAPTIAIGAANAAADVSLSGSDVEFTTVDAATATLSTTGPASTRLAGDAVTTSGALAMSSDAGLITIDTIDAGGGLTVTSNGAVAFGAVNVIGGATIQTSGASSDLAIADTLTATGAVSLTSGRDISANLLNSSGSSLAVTAARNVTGNAGGDVALGAAGAVTLTAGSTAKLSTVNGDAITLEAGSIDAASLSGRSAITVDATAGAATLGVLATTGGNATLNATGAMTIAGDVSIAGNYSVRGASVTLSGDQSASGAVDIAATTGSISSGPAMRLTANSDGVGAESLTLRGMASLAADSLLRGGPDRQSRVILDAPGSIDVVLGNVDAASLEIAGGAPLGGSLTVGNVVTSDPLALSVDGGITAASLRSLGGAVTLAGAGGATVSEISSAGALDIGMGGPIAVETFTAGGPATFSSSGSDITLGTGSSAGTVRISAFGVVRVDGAVSAGGDYRVRGSSLALGADSDAEVQSAAGLIDLTTTSGDVVGGPGLTLRSGGRMIVDAAGAIDFDTGVLEAGTGGTEILGVRAGAGRTIDLGETIRIGGIGSVDAAHGSVASRLTHDGNLVFGTLFADAIDIRLTGGSLSGTALTVSGTAAIDTGSGAVDVGTLDAATLSLAGGTITGGAYRAAGDLSLSGDTITLGELSSASGSALATSRAGRLSIDQASAGIDLALRTSGPGDVSVGLASAGRDLTLEAQAGNVLTDRAAAGRTLTIKAAGDLLGRTGASPVLSGNEVALDLLGSVAIGDITVPGNLTIRASSISIENARAGAALSLTSTVSNLSAGLVEGGGPVALTAAAAIDVRNVSSAGAVSITSGTDLAVQGLSAAGSAAIAAGGTATLGESRVNTLSLTAQNASLGTTIVAEAADLAATGAIAIADLAAGSASIVAGSDINAVAVRSQGALTASAGGTANLGRTAAQTLTATAGGITAEALDVSGATNLTATRGITFGRLASGGEARITAGTDLSAGELSASKAVISVPGTSQIGILTADALQLTGGIVRLDDAAVAGTAAVDTNGALVIGRLAAADAQLRSGTTATLGESRVNTLSLRAQDMSLGTTIVAGAADLAATGAIAIADLTAGSASLVAGSDINAVALRSQGALTANAGGTANLGRTVAQTLTATASGITAEAMDVSGATSLTATRGITFGRLTSGGDAQITAGTDLAAGELSASKAIVSAPGTAQIGILKANSIALTGGAVRVDDATIAGAAAIDAKSGLALGRLAAADAQLTSSGALDARQLSVSNAATLSVGGRASLGSVSAGKLSVTAAGITLNDANVGGLASLASSGDLAIERANAADLSLTATGAARLGTVTGNSAITVRAGDVAIGGQLRAPTVTLVNGNAAGGLRLGSADRADGSFGLSEAEIGRIDADRAIFDGGSGQVEIGALAFGPNSGRRNVDILSLGDIAITGGVSGAGAGRTFRFGGSAATDTDLATAIRIVSTPDAGGRLFFEGADVDLRGTRIALGQSGFLDALFANGGLSSEQATAAYVSNSNSALYSGLAGGAPYLPGTGPTLTASRLTVRFAEFALFQNTGTRGFNTGVVLTGSPEGGPTLTLRGRPSGTPSVFAAFGSINGTTDTSTAVLGNSAIEASGVDTNNARINGCVIGSGAGCLTTTIAQPTLNIFDPGRLVVFRAEEDFVLPFDPVIGSNNEALFAGIGAVGGPYEACPEGDPACVAAQENQQ
ncbi:two-partner secretion domain-containing protein [Allosphingosinicella deserti]|nr:filamentous hemagglutinin N-terminal domain-containing protein [Sphingomonas deserti]